MRMRLVGKSKDEVMLHIALLMGLNPNDRTTWPVDAMERLVLDADDAGVIRLHERVRQMIGAPSDGRLMSSHEVARRVAEGKGETTSD